MSGPLSKPRATWRWTCERCGETYPSRELVALKVDAEAQWKYHAKNHCDLRLEAVMGDVEVS